MERDVTSERVRRNLQVGLDTVAEDEDSAEGIGADDAEEAGVAESADAVEGTVEAAVEGLSNLWADLKGWD